jgi:hypothetical protein
VPKNSRLGGSKEEVQPAYCVLGIIEANGELEKDLKN